MSMSLFACVFLLNDLLMFVCLFVCVCSSFCPVVPQELACGHSRSSGSWWHSTHPRRELHAGEHGGALASGGMCVCACVLWVCVVCVHVRVCGVVWCGVCVCVCLRHSPSMCHYLNVSLSQYVTLPLNVSHSLWICHSPSIFALLNVSLSLSMCHSPSDYVTLPGFVTLLNVSLSPSMCHSSSDYVTLPRFVTLLNVSTLSLCVTVMTAPLCPMTHSSPWPFVWRGSTCWGSPWEGSLQQPMLQSTPHSWRPFPWSVHQVSV